MAEGHQRFNIANYSDYIDTGRLNCSVSALLGGYGNQEDYAIVTVYFYSANETTYPPLQIGPVTSADRNDLTSVLRRSNASSVPISTRDIDVVLSFARVDGMGSDGYADDVVFLLYPIAATTKLPTPAPLTPPPRNLFFSGVRPVIRLPTSMASLSQLNVADFKRDLMKILSPQFSYMDKWDGIIKVVACSVARTTFGKGDDLVNVCGATGACSGANTQCPIGVQLCVCDTSVGTRRSHALDIPNFALVVEVQIEVTYDLSAAMSFQPTSQESVLKEYTSLGAATVSLTTSNADFILKYAVDVANVMLQSSNPKGATFHHRLSSRHLPPPSRVRQFKLPHKPQRHKTALRVLVV